MRRMKNRSNWRSLRMLEGRLERQLHQRHSLRLHGFCIGAITLLLMWLTSHLQMLFGVESLGLRYLVSLSVGYLGYLLVLRFWAERLLGRSERGSSDSGAGDALDIADGLSELMPGRSTGSMSSGHGGDFGGAGASGDFGGDAVESLSKAGAEIGGGMLDGIGDVDEGVVIVIPILAIFAIGTAIFLGSGALLMAFFGWDALLAVAVELAFAYVSARAATRIAREGWLSAAVRLTWKPLLGAIVCAALLGATIDHFMPQANSLPQAIKLMRTQLQAPH
jgi:hypothetical protein